MTKKKQETTTESGADGDGNNNVIKSTRQLENEEILKYIDKKMKDTENTIINFIEMNTRIVNSSIDTVIKDVTALKECYNFQEDVFDKKIIQIEEKIEKIKTEVVPLNNNVTTATADIPGIEMIKQIKEKLTDSENRSRRNNLRLIM